MHNAHRAHDIGTRVLPWSTLRLPLTALLVAVAYFLSISLALAVRLPNTTFSPIWPPIAILLAVLLLTPTRRWWIWLLIMVPAHLLAYTPLGAPLWRQGVQIAHNLLIVLLPAIVLRRYAPEAVRLTTLSGVLTFLATVVGAGLLVPLCSAAIYVAFGVTSAYWLMWRLIAFSNILAYLAILPAILLVVQNGSSWLQGLTRARVAEAGLLAALVVSAGWVVFGETGAGPHSDLYIRTATLPLLLWAAVRFGPGGVSLAVVALTLIAIRGASLGFGPFTADAPIQNVLNVPSYFFTFAAPALLLAALLTDRRRGEAAMVQLNAELEDRIAVRTAELAQTNEALAIARDQAESANRAKSDFLATMSHELRTPLNAVLGLTTLLLASPLSAAQRDDVGTIRRSGNTLLTLIDDILDLSKIEAGKLALEYQPFALRACVEEALDLLAPLADAKQLALRYQPDPALPDMFVGDPARLRQILVNLLSNAVRFTEHGTITLALSGSPLGPPHERAQRWQLALSVRDTGIGITPEQQERIFQPFIQASPLSGQRYGGTGLGLTISRRLVELMGGQIAVVSQPGAGSTFTVTLALDAPPAPAPAFLAPAQPLLAGKRALLLAEEPALGDALAQQLSGWHMVPLLAHASEALAALAANQPVDAILFAHESAAPEVALLGALRTAVGQPSLPAVLWAPVSQRGLVLDQIDPASTAVLPLPLRPAALHDALARLLGPPTDAPLAAPGTQLDATLGVRHPLRILLAEDNATNQQVARRLLAKLGYGVDVAATGLEVLEALRRQPYDLVLMDVQMPAMSGTEATHYIRSSWPPERQPRIVAMTAYASEENRVWLLRTGMDDYVRKPVHLPELVRVLQTAGVPAVSPANGTHPSSHRALDAALFTAFLAETGTGDAAADAAFLARYLGEIDAQVGALRAALADRADERVLQVAHTLKGLSYQIGALGLMAVCERVEAQGTKDGAAVLESLEAAAELFRRALVARK